MVPIAIVGVAANIDVGAWNADYDFGMGLREYSNGHGSKCHARGQKRSHLPNASAFMENERWRGRRVSGAPKLPNLPWPCGSSD